MRDFSVVVLPGAYASSVAATLDVLDAARTLALADEVPAFRVRICSVEGGPVALGSGFSIETRRLSSTRPDAVHVVPGLGLADEASLAARLEAPETLRLVRLLARRAERGAFMAASCSAVFVLGAAGLLEGRRATTAWWLAPLLTERHPECRLDAARMLCADGPVRTAGAAFAQVDLMLALVHEILGADLAERVARTLLLDGREAQAPYVTPLLGAQSDALVARVVDEIEERTNITFKPMDLYSALPSPSEAFISY